MKWALKKASIVPHQSYIFGSKNNIINTLLKGIEISLLYLKVDSNHPLTQLLLGSFCTVILLGMGLEWVSSQEEILACQL